MSIRVQERRLWSFDNTAPSGSPGFWYTREASFPPSQCLWRQQTENPKHWLAYWRWALLYMLVRAQIHHLSRKWLDNVYLRRLKRLHPVTHESRFSICRNYCVCLCVYIYGYIWYVIHIIHIHITYYWIHIQPELSVLKPWIPVSYGFQGQNLGTV